MQAGFVLWAIFVAPCLNQFFSSETVIFRQHISATETATGGVL